MWPFKRQKIEKRQSYTGLAMQLREASIAGASGLGELTAAVQTCVGLWESGLSAAIVDGTDVLTHGLRAIIGRQLALHGEAVFLIRDRLVPAYQWEVDTLQGLPVSYRLSIADVAGASSVVALAGEVIHFRIGSSASAPWTGTAPLHRASLTSGLLQTIESTLVDVYSNAPMGSQIVAMPEDPSIENNMLERSFRGQHGRVLLRESTQVTAAGGIAPQSDWKPQGLTPDLSRAVTSESLQAAKAGVLAAYGVLPCLLDEGAAGPAVREAQRHLAQWTLQPIAEQMAEEASQKLGMPVRMEVAEPLRAFDAGGRARALLGVLQAMTEAKEAGLDESTVQAAAKFAGVSNT